MDVLLRSRKIIPRFIGKYERPQRAKTILKQKQQKADFKTLYKVVIIKTPWHCYIKRNVPIKQNRNPTFNSCSPRNKSLTNEPLSVPGESTVSSTSSTGKTRSDMLKKEGN